MYKVCIVGQNNEGKAFTKYLGSFDSFDSAVHLCKELNVLLRELLLCIYRDLLEWRFDIYFHDKETGNDDLVGVMDSDSEEIRED